MRMRLLTLALAAILVPAAIGCGGSESSYQDRQGSVDQDAEVVVPGAPGSESASQ